MEVDFVFEGENPVWTDSQRLATIAKLESFARYYKIICNLTFRVLQGSLLRFPGPFFY